MKSSSGSHFIALDHVRALAAFMVFAWHFLHASHGFPVPFGQAPVVFPFALLDEGHSGVALFMTLSGYLFAKLLDGKAIDYGAFIWNRALRLFPLLAFVLVLAGIESVGQGFSLAQYAYLVAKGAVLPCLPNGGWSITAEFHFYLVLPLLLWLQRRSRLWLVAIVLMAIGVRSVLHHERGEVQALAFFTIIGRIDQFVLGMLLWAWRELVTRRHLLAIATILAFMAGYWCFDRAGGFYENPSYPSPRLLWVVLPTIEGLCYAVAITWYDMSFTHSTSRLSTFVARIGEYSYSIYLLHFFVVFRAARFIHERIMDISNFYVAIAWALVVFIAMVIPASISYRFIESPFLKYRRRYVR